MDLNGIDRCLDCMQDKSGAQVCPHCGWDEDEALRSSPYLPYGTRLNDQYVLGRILGHGGFGITYLAWDTRLDTRVALKEYLPRDFGTRAADGLSVTCFNGEAEKMFAYGRKQFLKEAQKLARFSDYPSIVSVLNYFEAQGTAYMVMQYVEGTDLKQHLARTGERLPVDTALDIMTPVLDALKAVHGAGLLHRDISPDNIYLTSDGRILILDFGAAKDATGTHSQSQALIRKPGYSPEEQYRAKGEQGPWTDVYAAAATLYRMLTGEVPPEALDRLADDGLRPPSQLGVAMDQRQEAVLMKALAVRAPERYQNITDFQNALVVSTDEQAGAAGKGTDDKGQVSESKSKIHGSNAGKLSLFLLLAVILGGLGWLVIDNIRDKNEQEAARLRHEKELAQIKANQERAKAEQARLEAEELARQLEQERRSQVLRKLQEREAAKHEREKRERAKQLAEQRRQKEKMEADRARREAASCPRGYLGGAQIRSLLTGKTAYGVRVGSSSGARWKEYQGGNDTAYFQKDGGNYIRGKWKVSGNTACWCYGTCEEYKCKRVWVNNDCTKVYYEEPDTGKRTGRIYRLVEGDQTG
ncbi:MAG: protein kinase [Candidatus Thiosymbion ectosymbiont of Robbea hypermnestra]|nr:protein kinase [Candidatus Thiosymbion ectosymbiont of Robbea hypermnestra]